MTTWPITCPLLIILGERFIQEMVHGYKDKVEHLYEKIKDEDLYEEAKDTESKKVHTKV
jgi:hypothetical protein